MQRRPPDGYFSGVSGGENEKYHHEYQRSQICGPIGIAL